MHLLTMVSKSRLSYLDDHLKSLEKKLRPSAIASSCGDKTRLANIKDWKYLSKFSMCGEKNVLTYTVGIQTSCMNCVHIPLFTGFYLTSYSSPSNINSNTVDSQRFNVWNKWETLFQFIISQKQLAVSQRQNTHKKIYGWSSCNCSASSNFSIFTWHVKQKTTTLCWIWKRKLVTKTEWG